MQFKLLNNAKDLKFSVNESGTTLVKGYASVFGGVDTYGDMIMPGAYTKTLQNRTRPVLMRWNHFGPIIGKWLVMQQDERGLYVEGELTPGHSVANDAAASLKHGSVDGLSIGFYLRDYEQDGVVRRLKEIELIEVSIVEEPADNLARISDVKNALKECVSLKEIESQIRAKFGISQAEATAIVSSVKRVYHSDCEQAKKIGEMFEKFTITNEGK